MVAKIHIRISYIDYSYFYFSTKGFLYWILHFVFAVLYFRTTSKSTVERYGIQYIRTKLIDGVPTLFAAFCSSARLRHRKIGRIKIPNYITFAISARLFSSSLNQLLSLPPFKVASKEWNVPCSTRNGNLGGSVELKGANFCKNKSLWNSIDVSCIFHQ